MSDMNPGADTQKIWSSMPHHGQTPMLAWTSVATSGSTDVTWTLRVPKDVVEDIAAVAPVDAGVPLPAVVKAPAPRLAN